VVLGGRGADIEARGGRDVFGVVHV
jgi:hypothetical protein